MILAPVILLFGQVLAPLLGTAVDGEGRPLAGIEIMLVRDQAPDGTVPILRREMTDAQGRYTIAAPALNPRSAGRVAPWLCAYHPGCGLVGFITLLRPGEPDDFRLAFHTAGRRTITVRDGDGRPLAGVRVAPWAVGSLRPGYPVVLLPDALADRTEATTGADGRAELACLDPTTELACLRVAVPGLGLHAVALSADQLKSEAVVLDLKRAGPLFGRVRHEDGRPAAGVQIDVWSRAGARAPHLMPVRFESGPVRSGEDGSYRTPSALLAGVKYRALIRAPGFKPVLTQWVAPEAGADGAVSPPSVLLTPLRDVEGRVLDRQGRPVVAAEVIAAGEGASATSDAMGRFRVVGVASSRPLLVVRRDGFRIDGRLLAERAGAVEVVLARFDELAARPLTTLESPIPSEERRRLARRVLEPYLAKVLARGEDSPKAWALRSLMTFDPGAVLEALDRTEFDKADHYQSFLREELAGAMARSDPDDAAAVATSIPEAYRRAQALVNVCVALPDDQRARKRALVDQVLLSARAEPEPKLKLWQLGEAGELLLDLGEADRARAVFAEGRPIAEKLGAESAEFLGYYASRLARVDLPAAIALLGGIAQAKTHAVAFGNLAARIAASDPAEAERLAEAIRDGNRSGGVTLRICQNLARTDLGRARRLARGQPSPALRATALIFAASGLPAAQRQTAGEVVREALGEMDRMPDEFGTYRPIPAALMPLVESIDPALVPELFWRTVADLGVAADPRVEHGRDDVLRAALLLARYDRDVASALFEPADKASASRGADAGSMLPNELTLLAAIDPRRAVATVEAMPDPGNLETRDANWSRIILSEQLGGDVERQWRRIWSIYSGLGGILDRRDVL